jgi:heme A synthase
MSQPALDPPRRGLRNLAWFVLVFTVVVVISGDIVQATESGAGCGETWPRCDGALIPGIGDQATAIEFTHRALTAALGIAFVALLVAAWRHGRSHRVWRASLWATGFLVIEIVFGALLVVFGWVEDDASLGRVIADGVHLVNTFLLVGAVAVVVHYASGGRAFSLDLSRLRGRLIAAGGLVLIAVGITGAINSLADTLYFADTVDVDETEIASILISIRGIHPAVAIGGGLAIFAIVRYLTVDATGAERRLGWFVQGVVWAQFVFGLLNIALLTPMEVQVVHLLTAEALWIGYVFLGMRLTATPIPRVAAPEPEEATS